VTTYVYIVSTEDRLCTFTLTNMLFVSVDINQIYKGSVNIGSEKTQLLLFESRNDNKKQQ